MSAICGILSINGSPPQRDVLERMMQAMARHGPDGSGRWQNDFICLGHQMMHVTPESLGEHMPLYDAESRIGITMDGRIDNCDDLLRALGLASKPQLPDSQLILKAFQKWGKACAEHLVGEFAFAIWDGNSHSLHCYTDSMGIRPLFYREVSGKYFAFASEVRPLLAISEGRTALNAARLAMLGVSAMTVYLEPEWTCFEGIYRVPAASTLTVTRGKMRITEYWSPDPGKRLHLNTDGECREAFQEVFFKAVKARLRSAFPVASMLSGGLDSSAIVAAASQLLARDNRALVTLSSMPAPESRGQVVDEHEYIDLFRGRENLVMREVCAPGCGPFDDLEILVKSASLCSYSFQHYLYSAFVRTARDNQARVILDGHGGELSASSTVSGYVAELLLAGRWKRLRRELKAANSKGVITVPVIKGLVLRPLFPYILLKWLNRHDRFGDLIPFPIKRGYIRDILGPGADRVKEEVLRLPDDRPDHRKNMAHDLLLERRDARQRSHAGFVGHQDAAFSYPFLDRRVLEFALAVDGRFKYRDGRKRLLLRLGMEGLLPTEILSRNSKVPFAPDYPLRYERQKGRAFELLEGFSESEKLNGKVDFSRAMQAATSTTTYNPQTPMRGDHDSQFTVPHAIYLCYFLDRFGG